MRRRSLSFKLLLSYVLVVAVASAAAFGTARWLGPRLFDHEVQQIGQRLGWSVNGSGQGPGSDNGSSVGTDSGAGRGRGQGTGTASGTTDASGTTATTVVTSVAAQEAAIDQELTRAFTGALSVAMLVALGVGLIAGLLAAALISRRLLRPLDRMRQAVRKMAAGDHSQQVPVPPDRELAALAADVNALGAALNETEQRRARLVSDLSHELRTPITALDGFLEGLGDGVFQPDAETLSAMRSETRRLERLAADLGSLSRAAEDAFDLQLQQADLGDIAAGSARALSGAAATAGVSLDFDDLPPLPARCDPDRMAQVVTNLVRNAIQHTPSGGTVTLVGVISGGQVVLRVIDTGPGLPADALERVFERFVRLGDGGSGGAGIGLTIARGIVRAHGGDLTAANRPDRAGAEFRVAIPRA
jgi:histidine kinase